MKKSVIFFILVLGILSSCRPVADKMDLSGEWAFALDSADVGIKEEWYAKSLAGKIKLPGSLQEQGYGEDVSTRTQWTGSIVDSAWFNDKAYEKYRREGNIKIPFWLQPEKHYVGVAWYQREIEIPESWKGKHIELELERTHWETTLFINGKEAGYRGALSTPHRYVIEKTGKIVLTIRVDNRIHVPVGINAHSVSDHTQSNWNGITGNISITAHPSMYISNVRVYPDVKNKKFKTVVFIGRNSSEDKAEIKLSVKSNNSTAIQELKPVVKQVEWGNFINYKEVEIEVDMGDNMLTWSEYEPNLYQLEVELLSKAGKDIHNTTFGMREFKAQGTRFTVNDVPVFLRGTLECAIFPLTGYPSMDTAYWGKIYKRCKEFGLNHVRFHSWCPPEVAFEAADRAGIYLQVECGAWTEVGDNGTFDLWLSQETGRILEEYGNHPSFCLMAYGNEPGGANQEHFLSNYVDYWKKIDPRRVYTGAAGWPYLPNADYWNTPEPRIQHWGAGLSSIINAEPPRTDYDFASTVKSKNMPVVSHEIGQWCVYPDFKEIAEYTGVLKAKNFEIFKETLEKHNMGDLADKFLYASGRLQTLCYKADIEAALRTPGFAGFQLLDIHDFPGQGTALVGVLDPFWNPKGYVDGNEYSMFCNRTVPLARMHKLVWVNNETFHAAIEVSHFDKQALTGATIEWEITDASNKVLAKGETTKDLPITNCIPVSEIKFDLSSIHDPAQLKLSVKVAEAGASNQWNFWVYPATEEKISFKPYISSNNSYITSDYADAVAHVNAGEKVLYCLRGNELKADKGGDIKVGFSSIFWNTAWTRKQAPHTLGVYCDPAHPVFASFPNNGYSDYQWWDVITGSSAMVMDDFPSGFRPLVHLIDDWFTNRKLGILFEAKAGAGKLIVCSADLTSNLDKRPAARQFKRSIVQYMASDKFNPKEEIDLNTLKGLLK